MKNKKLTLVISAIVCMVLAVAVMIVAFTAPDHKHNLGEAKTYHLTNKGIYYTRDCDDGCSVKFETEMLLADVFTTSTEIDTIMLDENVVLKEEVVVKSFITKDELPFSLNLNINLDLNEHTLTTDIDDVENNSVFMLNANYGKINFNIKNGKIETEDLSYVFRFSTPSDAQDTICLNTNNVEYKVTGHKATPIYAHNECAGITVNANNSKFIARKGGKLADDYGVGVFINSESEFNFTDCYFEGADAIHVKHGTVNLTGCELVNIELAQRSEQATDPSFTAIGSCLAAETYTTSTGMTKFTITITDCSMVGNYSSIMIYVAQTGEMGQPISINPASSINVISCTFNNNPTAIVDYEIVHYPNNQAPQNQGNQTWVA